MRPDNQAFPDSEWSRGGHGGKRKGAGRKPRSAPREAITVRLEPEDAHAFRELCERAGKSQSRQIAEWIKSASRKK